MEQKGRKKIKNYGREKCNIKLKLNRSMYQFVEVY